MNSTLDIVPSILYNGMKKMKNIVNLKKLPSINRKPKMSFNLFRKKNSIINKLTAIIKLVE